MVYLLIQLLILLIVLGLVAWVVQYLALPDPWLTIIRVVLVVIFILVLLSFFLPGFYRLGPV